MITLLCVATSNPKPTITWTKGSSVKQQTSVTNYTISSAAKEDAGTYTCTARGTVPGLSVQSENYQVTVTVRCKWVQFVLIDMVFLNWLQSISMKCYVHVQLYAPLFPSHLINTVFFPWVPGHYTSNSRPNAIFISLRAISSIFCSKYHFLLVWPSLHM